MANRAEKQAASNPGRTLPSNAGNQIEVQQADYVISAAITELDFDTRVKSFGGGMIPVIGSVQRKTQRAALGMDVKIVDVNRARVLDARTFVADSSTSSTSLGGFGWGPGFTLVGGLSRFRSTPMKAVIRDLLTQVAAHSAGTLRGFAQSAPGAAVEALSRRDALQPGNDHAR